VPRIIKVGLSKVGNQTKPLNIPNKSFIFYRFRADIQTYGHRPQCRVVNDAAENGMDAQKARLLLSQGYGQYEAFQNQLATCKSRLSCSPIGRSPLV
jgi:hypothetical protein